MNRCNTLALLVVFVLCLTSLATISFAATRLYRDAVLRETPSYLGAPLATLERGTSVTQGDSQGDWIQVTTKEQQKGWLPEGALKKPTVSLGESASRAHTRSSAGEVAMAGKGFDEEAEKQARKSSSGDFAAVDYMQSFVMSHTDCEAFLRAGRTGGGR